MHNATPHRRYNDGPRLLFRLSRLRSSRLKNSLLRFENEFARAKFTLQLSNASVPILCKYSRRSFCLSVLCRSYAWLHVQPRAHQCALRRHLFKLPGSSSVLGWAHRMPRSPDPQVLGVSRSTTLDVCLAPRRSATLRSCRRAVRLTLRLHPKTQAATRRKRLAQDGGELNFAQELGSPKAHVFHNPRDPVSTPKNFS